MSHQASTWAFDQQNMASGTKLLLVCIANIADEYGICYPGRTLLAERCCSTTKTVSEHLHRLEERQLLARIGRRRPNGSRTSDFIILAPLAGDRAPMRDAPDEEFPEPVAALAKSLNLLSPNDSSPNDLVGGQGKNSGSPEPSGNSQNSPPVVPPEGGRTGTRSRRRRPVSATASGAFDPTAPLDEISLHAYRRMGVDLPDGATQADAEQAMEAAA